MKRLLLRWLMPDAVSALRLLQARFGDDVGISWSPPNNVSVVHSAGLNVAQAELALHHARQAQAMVAKLR